MNALLERTCLAAAVAGFLLLVASLVGWRSVASAEPTSARAVARAPAAVDAVAASSTTTVAVAAVVDDAMPLETPPTSEPVVTQPVGPTAPPDDPARAPAPPAQSAVPAEPAPPPEPAATEPATTEAPPETDPPTTTAPDRLARVVHYALAQVGKPYRFGTAGPNAFDCSGLTLAAYRTIGIALPHASTIQATYGRAVDRRREPIRAGDLLLLRGGDPVQDLGHVGLAVSATEWVVAPHEGARVRAGPIPTGSIQAVRRLVG